MYSVGLRRAVRFGNQIRAGSSGLFSVEQFPLLVIRVQKVRSSRIALTLLRFRGVSGSLL